MNAIAATEFPRGQADDFGGLLRQGETPEQALKRLEKTKTYTKTIGTEDGQRLLAAATKQVTELRHQSDGSAERFNRELAKKPPESERRRQRTATHERPGAEPSGVAETRSADAPSAGSSDGGSPETERAMASATPGRNTQDDVDAGPHLGEVPLDLIDIGANVRADPGDLQGLADSIAELGLQQPVTVTLTDAGRYTLLLGQRRVLASRLAGLTTIRALILLDPTEVLAKPGARRASEQLAENRVRLAMNPVEEAIALRAILDADKTLTQAALAKRIGMSEPWIASTLALLKAPAKVQELVRADKISLAHAKAVSGLPADVQVRLAQNAAANGVSAHSLEESAKWERRTQGERDAGRKRTEAAGTRAIAALEKAAVAKDAVLYVTTEHWQVDDAEVRKAIRAAGWRKVQDGWSYGGERWSKCDCTTLNLRVKDGDGSTVSPVCVSDKHRNAMFKEQDAKRQEANRALDADRKRLEGLVKAAIKDVDPTVIRLLGMALQGYGKTWKDFTSMTDVAARQFVAGRVAGNPYGREVPYKTIFKALGVPATEPPVELPSGRKPGKAKAVAAHG